MFLLRAGAFLLAVQFELVDALLSEYDVDRETAERSVLAFTTRLKELNFLA